MTTPTGSTEGITKEQVDADETAIRSYCDTGVATSEAAFHAIEKLPSYIAYSKSLTARVAELEGQLAKVTAERDEAVLNARCADSDVESKNAVLDVLTEGNGVADEELWESMKRQRDDAMNQLADLRQNVNAQYWNTVARENGELRARVKELEAAQSLPYVADGEPCKLVEVTDLIRYVMEFTGIKQIQMADALGSTRGHICQLLTGQKNMTIEMVSDLFRSLGCDVYVHASPVHPVKLATPTIKQSLQVQEGGDVRAMGEVLDHIVKSFEENYVLHGKIVDEPPSELTDIYWMAKGTLASHTSPSKASDINESK